MTLSAWAAYYVRCGLQVVPLHTPVAIAGELVCSCDRRPCPHKMGKHPRPGYGKDHAISDLETVDVVWRRWPDANVALVIPPGYLVLDLDGAGAVERWQRLQVQHGSTATRMARTGRYEDSRHLWFKNSGAARDGVLERGEGWQIEVVAATMGYVVAPPSLHQSGRRYEWLDERQTVEAPGWLSELVQLRPKAIKPNGHGPERRIPTGRRHEALVEEAGHLRRRGYGTEATLNALRDWRDEWCEDPESVAEDELRSIAGSTEDWRQTPRPPLRISGGANGQQTGDGRPDRLRVESTNPKTWLLYFPGIGVLRLSSAELKVWGKIETAHLEQFESVPRWAPSGQDPWLGPGGHLQTLFGAMAPEDHIVPPPELTIEGRVLRLLRDYVGHSSEEASQLAHGAVWRDAGGGRYVFKADNLFSHNESRALGGEKLNRREISRVIRDLGGDVSTIRSITVAGQQPRLSWIPAVVLEAD